MNHEACVTKKELEEEFRNFRNDIYDEIGQKYNEAMSRVHQTSPETKKELEEIHKWINTHESWRETVTSKLDDLVFAFYGNKERDEIGMKKQVSEMYEAIIKAKGIKGFFQTFLLVGGVGAMLYALFKRF